MTLHTEVLNDITIPTSDTTRLVVSRWDAPSGRALVSIRPEYQDRRGDWHLAHSAVSVPPAEAPELAVAVLRVAAEIDGGPVDPMPSAEDRELSRRP
jgi:hypothetical protein